MFVSSATPSGLVAAAYAVASSMRSDERRIAEIAERVARANSTAEGTGAAYRMPERHGDAPDDPVTAATTLVEVERSYQSSAAAQRGVSAAANHTLDILR